jgi:hypothetical protein
LLKALQKVSRVHLISFLITKWWAFIVSKFSTDTTYFIFFWCTLMISDQNSSFETDDNHSSRSTSACILIEFYHRLREESLTAISRHVKDLRVSDYIAFIKGHYLYILLLHSFVTKDMHSGSTEGIYILWWKQQSNCSRKGYSGVFLIICVYKWDFSCEYIEGLPWP